MAHAWPISPDPTTAICICLSSKMASHHDCFIKHFFSMGQDAHPKMLHCKITIQYMMTL